MKKIVKNTLLSVILVLSMTNIGHAFDLDATVDDEIRKNYNPNKLIEDVGLKNNALNKNIIYDSPKIDPNLPDLEKYKIIHDKLSKTIQYDYSALQATSHDSDYYTSRNLENGLLNHTCVCAGYADILKNILAELGIESKYVEGKTHTGELHAWNQVRLLDENGTEHWYNVDLTWDCTDKNNNYFLQDDATFSKTHTPILSRTENHTVFNCPSAVPYKKAPTQLQNQEVDFEK